MGVIITTKVATRTNYAGRPRIIQPGNWEWVTIIKAINALRVAIPLLVIFKVVMHQATWYKNDIILYNWLIGISNNS